jgi:hypothetical protein
MSDSCEFGRNLAGLRCLGRAVAELVIRARGDGAVGLDKDRGRDAITCQYPTGVVVEGGVFLHGIEQDTVEVLVVSPDVLCRAVSLCSGGGNRAGRLHSPYHAK